jgi:hypothetical protein
VKKNTFTHGTIIYKSGQARAVGWASRYKFGVKEARAHSGSGAGIGAVVLAPALVRETRVLSWKKISSKNFSWKNFGVKKFQIFHQIP